MFIYMLMKFHIFLQISLISILTHVVVAHFNNVPLGLLFITLNFQMCASELKMWICFPILGCAFTCCIVLRSYMFTNGNYSSVILVHKLVSYMHIYIQKSNASVSG